MITFANVCGRNKSDVVFMQSGQDLGWGVAGLLDITISGRGKMGRGGGGGGTCVLPPTSASSAAYVLWSKLVGT